MDKLWRGFIRASKMQLTQAKLSCDKVTFDQFHLQYQQYVTEISNIGLQKNNLLPILLIQQMSFYSQNMTESNNT